MEGETIGREDLEEIIMDTTGFQMAAILVAIALCIWASKK